MAILVDGTEWLYPPCSFLDCAWGAVLAVVLFGLVVSGWKAIRTGEMRIERTTVHGWSAISLGWMQVILGLGLALLIAGALIDHFFFEAP